MTSPATLTWDIAAVDGGARRASLDDCGGATVEDEDPLPDKARDLYADMVNQLERQIAALNRCIPAACISVRFSGATPSIYQATGPGSAVVPGLFTVVDNGPGDTTITWPSGSLPIPVLEPRVSRNVAAAGSIAAEYVLTIGVVTGVRVRSWDPSNAPVDHAFTVDVS